MGKKEIEIEPCFLVSPYFYADDVTDKWYQISLELARRSKEIAKKRGNKLYLIICIAKEVLLDVEKINRIIEDYKQFDGIIYWFNDFDEKTIGQNYSRGILNFISMFSRHKIRIISLYGGFFSTLFSKIGLSGGCSGICYSAAKKIPSQVAGGGIPARYYIKFAHKKLTIGHAFALFNDHPDLFSCSCPACVEYTRKIEQEGIPRGTREFIKRFFEEKKKGIRKEALDLEKIKTHFIYTRAKEIEEIASKDVEGITRKILEEYNLCKKRKLSILEPYQYLKNWTRFLEQTYA